MKGSLLKRGKNAWRIKFDLGRNPLTGKRMYAYKTVRGARRNAETEMRSMMVAADKGVFVNPTNTTLGQWIEIWLEDQLTVSLDGKSGSIRPKTHERYAQLLRKHVTPTIGAIPIQRLVVANVVALYNSLRKHGLSRGGEAHGLSETTISHVHRALSMALSDAVTMGLIASNVCRILPKKNKPRPKRAGGKTDKLFALNRGQMDEFLKASVDHQLLPFIILGFATGARRSELLALRWTDIDFERGLISISKSLEITSEYGIREVNPKTEQSIRTISVDQVTLRRLRAYKSQLSQRTMAVGTRFAESSYVFPKSHLQLNSPMIPNTVSRQFSRHASRIGFKGFTYHGLRHTHATLLLSEGVPVKAVAARLGHKNEIVTLTIYSHLLSSAEAQASKVAATLMEQALK